MSHCRSENIHHSKSVMGTSLLFLWIFCQDSFKLRDKFLSSFIYNKFHTFEVYNLISFAFCVHPWKHYHNQDSKYIYHPFEVRIRTEWNLLEEYLYLFLGRTVWHVGSQFPDQGSNPCPLHWKCRVLTTGPPGKSWNTF